MSDGGREAPPVQASALEHLIDEVRLTNHRLIQVAEGLHPDAPVSIAERALLEYLTRNGAETVPGIARARNVSRQHVQVGVNSLLEAGLVDQIPNPAHARSHLVSLTPTGRRTIGEMRNAEHIAIESLELGVSPIALEQAATTLASLRAALDNITSTHPNDPQGPGGEQ